MKKPVIALLALLALAGSLSAQAAAAPAPAAPPVDAAPADDAAPDAAKIGLETAQQKLKEVSIDKFETAGFWNAFISSDQGVATSRLFTGRPEAAAAEPVADPRYVGKDPAVVDKFVYGVKTQFYGRGYNEIFLRPNKPIPIEGITKTLTIWVVGRNYNHELWVELKDFFGNSFELPMGKLNFSGWHKLSVAIPPQSPDGRSGIVQRNFHYTSHMGLKVAGFRIACDPEEAFGTYYIYLDDMRAVTDLFAEDSRDKDDIADTW
jgi:hypothetical protein